MEPENGVAAEPTEATPINRKKSGTGSDIIDGAVAGGSFRQLLMENKLDVFSYCYAFSTFGMCIAILGPVLPDLTCITNTTLHTITWIFFIQSLFVILGCFIGGFILTRMLGVAGNVVMLIAALIMPITVITLPFSHNMPLLALLLAIMGICLGCIDSLANIKMIEIFRGHVGPFLQALHCSYGFGAFLSPLVAKPFIMEQDCSALISNISTTHQHVFKLFHGRRKLPRHKHSHRMEYYWLSNIRDEHAKRGHNFTLEYETISEAQDESSLVWAFLILGVIMLPLPALIYAIGRRDGTWTSCQCEEVEKSEKTFNFKEMHHNQYNKADIKFCSVRLDNQRQMWMIILLSGLAMFAADGLQGAIGDLMYYYTIRVTGVGIGPPTDAGYVQTVFWGSFAFGRLVSIFLATRYSPSLILLVDACGVFIGVLPLFSTTPHLSLIYVSAAILGLSVSNMTPSLLSQAEEYLDTTSSITTVLVVIASVGEMTFPVIGGYILDTISPLGFSCFLASTAFLFAFLLIFIIYVGTKTDKYKAFGRNDFMFWRSLTQYDGCRPTGGYTSLGN